VWASSVEGADPVPSWKLDPGQSTAYGNPEGDVPGTWWFYVDATIGVKKDPFFVGRFHNNDGITVDPDALTAVLTTVDPAHVTKVMDVGNSVAQAINAGKRSDPNPMLTQIAADPLAVLKAHGLHPLHFAHAIPSELAKFEQYLKDKANAQLEAAKSGRSVPRESFGCWACTVGLWALVVGVGAAMSAAVLQTGGALYALLVAFATRFVTAAAAANIVTGFSAAGLYVGEKAMEKLIEWMCNEVGACE